MPTPTIARRPYVVLEATGRRARCAACRADLLAGERAVALMVPGYVEHRHESCPPSSARFVKPSARVIQGAQ